METIPDMSLDECAQSMNQLNIDLQRQTDAYRYFDETSQCLHNIVHEEKVDGAERLPFVVFRFPLTTHPGQVAEYKLDLNELHDDELEALEPLFRALMAHCGTALLTAWKRIFAIVAAARHNISAAEPPDAET